ncbi:aldo/keto reductase [Boseongicola sp. H5]|uniref:aldo/keto reductase n=1 Tax=Rhodobacterales TaxID=204455 RepID=UPI001B1689DD|nr:aldo/keto reductase [Boseongicola sp. H5]MBO6603713.1 aldo/keto reductase [Roseicyclus sp.]MBO6623406.1 aldo/keto reductase [Roseicyclus sp.]MBO6920742.1 aldo/keto reductase [Roseicyclus sp.]
MKTRQIGQSGLSTSTLGLGCMAMSEFYGAFDEAENMATLERAMELGITMLDTADLYGDGRNEELLGRFIAQTSHTPLIASKCGIVRTDEIMSDGNFKRERCGTPDYITASCDDSLRRLGIDVIDLYYLHRVDPNVPVEDSMGALAELKAAGKIRAIGLSEPTADELTRANTVAPVDAVQSEYSLWTRLVEDEVLPVIRDTGGTLVCYSPLGRGLLRKTGAPPKLDADDFRRTLPRFTQDSFDANAPLFDLLDEVAAEAGVSVPQLMLIWLLDQGGDIVPIPGARKIAHLEQNAAAVDLSVDRAALDRLSAAFSPDAVVGARYTEGKAVKAG